MIEEISSHELEDEESGPYRSGSHSSEDVVNRNIPIAAAPITPSKISDADGKEMHSQSSEPEGDMIGQVDQFVVQPAQQGVLYKCRITRDRKGMDRGLFPIYYLHLERDYGKKIFLLGGEGFLFY